MSSHSLTHAHHQYEADERDVFGFWLYILTDCLLLASLFAVYLVLHAPGAYGPSLKPLINLPYVLGETFLLLGSNLTFGLAAMSLYKNQIKVVSFWLFLLVFDAMPKQTPNNTKNTMGMVCFIVTFTLK